MRLKNAFVKRPLRVVAAAAIIAACLGADGGGDHLVYGQPQNGFAVSLIVSSSSYRDGPHVSLTFWVKNTGASKLWVGDGYAGPGALSVSKLDGTALSSQSTPTAAPPPSTGGSSSNPRPETYAGGPKYYELQPGHAKQNDREIVDDLASFGIVPGQTYRVWAVAEIYGYAKNPWEIRHLATVVSNTILVTAPSPPAAR